MVSSPRRRATAAMACTVFRQDDDAAQGSSVRMGKRGVSRSLQCSVLMTRGSVVLCPRTRREEEEGRRWLNVKRRWWWLGKLSKGLRSSLGMCRGYRREESKNGAGLSSNRAWEAAMAPGRLSAAAPFGGVQMGGGSENGTGSVLKRREASALLRCCSALLVGEWRRRAVDRRRRPMVFAVARVDLRRSKGDGRFSRWQRIE